MDSHEPYVCTLTVSEIPDRAAQVSALRRGLIEHERDRHRVRLRFEPHLADLVDAFVRDESDCCSFFGFRVARAEGEVELTVSAPVGAEPMLDGLVAAVTSDDPCPEESGRARSLSTTMARLTLSHE